MIDMKKTLVWMVGLFLLLMPAMALADSTPPVVTYIYQFYNGWYMNVGNDLDIYMRIEDESEITNVNVEFVHQDQEYSICIDTFYFDGHEYTLRTSIPQDAVPGKYEIAYLSITDAAGNTTTLYPDDMPEYVFTVRDPNYVRVDPVYSNFSIDVPDGVMKLGDKLPVRISIEHVYEIDKVEANLGNADILGSGAFIDRLYPVAGTNVWEGTVEILPNANFTSGKFSMTCIIVYDIYGGEYRFWPEKDESQMVTVVNDLLKGIYCAQNGQTIKRNGSSSAYEVSMDVTVAKEYGISRVDVMMSNEEARDVFSLNVVNSYNASTGTYKLKGKFSEDQKSGKYVVSEVYIESENTIHHYTVGHRLKARDFELLGIELPYIIVDNGNAGPIIFPEGFRMCRSKTVLNAGDTFKLRAKINSKYDFTVTEAYFLNSATNDKINVQSQEYNAEDGYWYLNFTVPSGIANGSYRFTQIKAKDTYGTVCEMNAENESYFPKIAFIVGKAQYESNNPVVTEVKLLNDGQILYPGDELIMNLWIEDESEITTAWAQFYLDGKKEILVDEKITRDPSGMFVLKGTLPSDTPAGKCLFNWLFVEDEWGNSEGVGCSVNIPQFTFTVASVIQDTTPPVISNIHFAENGRVLATGQTMTLSASVTDDSEIARVYALMTDESGIFRIELPAFTYHSATGRYELSYPIPDAFFAATYQLTAITAVDVHGNTATAQQTGLKVTIVKNPDIPEDRKLTLPSDLLSVGEEAFMNSASLYAVYCPSGMTAIEARAFAGCGSLLRVFLPDSITSIANDAFQNCPNLILVCNQGSYAQQWADSAGMLWMDID